MFRRSDKLIKSVRNRISTAAGNMCTIGIRDVCPNASSTADYTKSADVLGVFALKEIAAVEIVLVDDTAASGLDSFKDRCDCCGGKLPNTPKFVHRNGFQCCEDKF